MKITKLEAYILRSAEDSRPHWVSHFTVPKANELLVRLETDSGIDGIGLATNYNSITPISRTIQTGIKDFIVDSDALAPEILYQKLFSLTWNKISHQKGWTRESLVRISAAIDIAAWDIVGKVANLPLYRIFGGFRSKIPCYVTCAYYRDGKDLIELKDEMEMLKDQGHIAFKVKAGGLSLSEDLKRLNLIREIIGNDKDLMIDVNRGWDLATAIEAVQKLESLNPLWIEEPVRWADDRRQLKLLSDKTTIPLSAGESELTSYGCRSLLEEQAVKILQFDCTMFGGFTEGRKITSLCELNHVQVAPHHDCFIHAHIVGSSPAGYFVESFTDPERDPLQAQLFETPPVIKQGMLTLNETPGIGLSVSKSALTHFGERIL